MKGNRFTGWDDGLISRYIRTKQSIHATTCGFWAGVIVAFAFIQCTWDTGYEDPLFAAVVFLGIGALCAWSVRKSKEECRSMEEEGKRRREAIEKGEVWED